MDNLHLVRVLILISALAASGTLRAHSFDIAVVAPYSGSQAQVGASLWQGMRIATREADGHVDETSDGHLGGVDSNLLRIDSIGGADTVSRQVRESGASIVVLASGLTLPSPAEDKIMMVILAGAFERVSLPDHYSPGVVLGKRQQQFEARYRKFYRENPDYLALGGYTTAQLIAIAVRSVDGDFSDREALRLSFDDAIRVMDKERSLPSG